MSPVDRFRDLVDSMDRRFEHSRLNPAWETMSTFFFSRRLPNPLAGPHIRDNTDLKRYMTVVMMLVAPTVLMSVYLFGWRSIALVALSYTVGIAIELGFAIANR